MKSWIKKRLQEPTTIMGLSSLAYGLMTILKADGAETVAQTIQSAAEPIASGDYTGAAVLTIGSILGIFMKESGNR